MCVVTYWTFLQKWKPPVLWGQKHVDRNEPDQFSMSAFQKAGRGNLLPQVGWRLQDFISTKTLHWAPAVRFRWQRFSGFVIHTKENVHIFLLLVVPGHPQYPTKSHSYLDHLIIYHGMCLTLSWFMKALYHLFYCHSGTCCHDETLGCWDSLDNLAVTQSPLMWQLHVYITHPATPISHIEDILVLFCNQQCSALCFFCT